MSTDPTSFQNDYLATGTEPDADRRSKNIQQMWNPGGRLIISSLGITVEGAEAITEHIAAVHGDLIAQKGLRFAYDQNAVAGDALLLRWSMLAPSGEAVGRGVDIVHRDAEGRAQTVYMFMGVD